MFQKKQLHDICNLDHHTKLPCYDFCKICVNYKQAPATVRIVEEIVAWILFIKQILCKPCFLPSWNNRQRQQALQKWMHFGFGMEVNLQIYCESSPWLGVVQLPESGVWIT